MEWNSLKGKVGHGWLGVPYNIRIIFFFSLAAAVNRYYGVAIGKGKKSRRP